MKSRTGVAEGVDHRARSRQRAAERAVSRPSSPRRAEALETLGVEVEVLDEKELEKLGMGALLGVGQGSRAREPASSIMRWNGAQAAEDAKPVAFIGKGVVFDTGGISIKPAGGMEDMKGDMAGAAASSA